MWSSAFVSTSSGLRSSYGRVGTVRIKLPQELKICSFGRPRETGFRIGAAHHDAPGFRVKTVPSSVDLGYERLILEQYGGTLVHGWVDRPLAVAGCVYVKDEENGFRAVNINMNVLLLNQLLL